MFDRFTEPGHRAIELAHEEARSLGHNHLGTEHLLLGLLRADGGVASKALSELGITLSGARAEVQEILGPTKAEVVGSEEDPSARPRPSTPRVMDVLVHAWREARLENVIGDEHILLALLTERQGVAAHVLVGSGITEARAREELDRLRG